MMAMISNRRRVVVWMSLAVMVVVYLSPVVSYAAESVKIKILAVNPSESNKMKTNVVHYLPPEVQPEDILDRAGMELKMDKEKKAYYLVKEVELAPKETLTTIVNVKNVWKVSEEDLSRIKGQLTQNLNLLKDTKYEKTGKLVYDKAMEQISVIEEGQQTKLGMRQMMEIYRAHKKLLEKIENDTMSLEAMRQLEMNQSGSVRKAKILIEAENPAKDKRKITVRSELPKEVTVDAILDKLDFNVMYDDVKGCFVLEKDEEFNASEKKRYEITIRDLWYIPDEELTYLVQQTETLTKYFIKSPYEEFSKQSASFIKDGISAIQKLQEEVKNTPDVVQRIRAFALNKNRIQAVKDRVKTMQDLLLEIPLKKSSVEQIADAIKRMRRIVNILQLGFQPDLATTWWIILGIIGFVAIFATVFYVTWLQKLKQSQFAEKLVIYINEAKKRIKKKKLEEAKAPEPKPGLG